MSDLSEDSRLLNEAAADYFSDAAYWLGLDGRFLHANRAACDLLGYSREQLLELAVPDIDPLYGPPQVAERLEEALARGPISFESVHRRRDGSEIPVEITVSPIPRQGPPLFVAVARDLTERKRSAEAVRRSEEELRILFERVPIGLYKSTPDGRLLEANPALVELLGYPDLASLRAIRVEDLYLHAEDRRSLLQQLGSDGVARDQEVRLRRRDGSAIWVRVNVRATTDPGSGELVYEGSLQEISEWKRTQEALRLSERRFRSLVQNASDMVSVIDPEGRVVYESPSHERILGHALADRIGNNVFELVHPDDQSRVRAALARVLETPGATLTAEYRFRHYDGSWRVLESTGCNLLDDPAVGGIVVNSRDVTARREAESQLRHQALHDALTGLPNRALFLDRLRSAILHFRRDPSRLFAVLFIDLDRFKIVNDSLGHTIGDRLLVEIGRLLSANLKPTDSVARVGGDEFLVLLDEIADPSSALRVAERIHRLLREPLDLDGQEVFTTASVGVSLARADSQSPDDYLREADTALHRAKAEGGATHVVFNSEMHRLAVERLRLESELHRAVDRGELLALYQPIFHLESGAIAAFEALVRWRHPSRGLLRPKTFLALAEETGLIRAIDLFVVGEACRALARWQALDAVPAALKVCANLSQKTLSHPETLSQLRGELEASGIAPSSLALEITEHSLFENADLAARALAGLKELGLGLSLDDFGTGFSSLSQLHRFPIDTLKIDRSFVRNIHSDRGVPEIVLAIVSLGHNLGLEVVAEGIERREQLRILQEMGCEYGQGTLLAEPIEAEAAAALLAKLAATARG